MSSESAGMALIEVLISGLLLIIASMGVFTAFDAGTRATAQERHRARANSLAEADLERLRSMRIVELATLNQSQPVTVDGTVYTVVSTSQFLNEPATTNTCAPGSGSRDYIRINSSVTWPGIGSRPPVTAGSLVSPPSGSVVPNSGSLLVSVDDSKSVGIPGVALSGGGAGSFSGTTNSNGCVLWRNLPAGNYTMTIGGAASSMVDRDGVAPSPKTISVVAGSTNTVALEYDRPGSMNVDFKTEPYGNGTLIPAPTQSMFVYNSGMPSQQPRQFAPTPPLTQASTIATTVTLFPFQSPSAYTVYAGTCSGDNPDPAGSGAGGLAVGSGIVPPAGSPSPNPVVVMPALHLTVYTGSTTSSSRAVGARVTAEDDLCSNFKRTYTTNSSGRLDNPGLPWSRYDLCVNNSAGSDFRTIDNVNVTNPNAGTVLNVFLGGQPIGTCP